MREEPASTADLLRAWRDAIRAAELAERLAAEAAETAKHADLQADASAEIATLAERAAAAASRAAERATAAAAETAALAKSRGTSHATRTADASRLREESEQAGVDYHRSEAESHRSKRDEPP